MKTLWTHADADGDTIKLTVEPGGHSDEEFALTAATDERVVVVCANREALWKLYFALERELGA